MMCTDHTHEDRGGDPRRGKGTSGVPSSRIRELAWFLSPAWDKNLLQPTQRSLHDEAVFSFTPARASDFWGICWETDTYNIWIQSGDIGVICYAYADGNWEVDPTAIRPDSIVSKYDK